MQHERGNITDPRLESFTALPASQRSVTLQWPVPVLAGAGGCHVHCACAAIACMVFIVAGQTAFSNIAGAGFGRRRRLSCHVHCACTASLHCFHCVCAAHTRRCKIHLQSCQAFRPLPVHVVTDTLNTCSAPIMFAWLWMSGWGCAEAAVDHEAGWRGHLRRHGPAGAAAR